MSRFIFNLIFFSCPFWIFAQGSVPDTAVKVGGSGHQLRLGFDISKVLVNSLSNDRSSYEAGVDYYLQNELYGVAEFGAGNSYIDYPDLSYTSNTAFIRAGIDKSLFVRKKPQDWGMAFMGARYGLGIIRRNEAQYTTNDGLGGITSGSIPADRFAAHWFELTGGMRVELLRNTFAGWNVRFKFLLNQKSFGALKPAYITGYGAGEKGTVFDYNFYLAYAIRWPSKK